ncbi:MAG: hypothetical protein KHX30_00700 [Clostridium sp.]|nr:hypothetical protein [Clostridium sp.]
MKEVFEERTALIMEIIDGKLTEEQIKKKMSLLEEKYGSNVFRPYIFEKKNRPWTEKYYDDLREKALCGANSREFLLYLNEVREDIEKQNKVKKMAIVAGVIIVVIIIFLMLF